MGQGAVIMILMFVVLAVLIGGGLYVKKMLVVTDPNTETEVDSGSAETAQEFLPFIDIDGYMLDLGNHRYRAIIECSSVNYNLKTDTERDVIELSFQKFISSLSFPVTFHIQTRIVDNTVIVRELEKDVERIREENPTVYEYAKTYLESMKNFDVYIGNVKQKKKYIIVGYEDAYVLGELTDTEKRELSRQQLGDRVSFIINQLSSLQIKGKCLGQDGLIDLLYNAYHREDSKYDISEMLGMGGYTTLTVEGENKMKDLSVEQKIDLELLRVQDMIKEECLDVRLGYSEEVYKEVSDIYNKLKILRDTIGSPYGTNYNMDIWEKKEPIKKNIDERVSSAIEKKSYVEPVVNKNERNVKVQGDTKDSNDWNSGYGVNNDTVVEESASDNDWSLDFGMSDDTVIEENTSNNNWSLDFGMSDDTVVEESASDNDWSLDFGSDSNDDKDDVDMGLETSNDDWNLDFGSDSSNDWSLDFGSDSNDDWSLDFGSDSNDDWSLDFGSDSNDDKDDILNFDENKNKGNKKNNRLMFD